MSQNTILWIYIILLVVGGLIGFLKAGSKVSLMTASISAALLVITTTGLFDNSVRNGIADAIMAALLVVFAVRLAKTKKFMPSGMMLTITIVALALRHITFH
jgi:Small integral membrane protein